MLNLGCTETTINNHFWVYPYLKHYSHIASYSTGIPVYAYQQLSANFIMVSFKGIYHILLIFIL